MRIERNPDVSQSCTKEGVTPLNVAREHGHTEIVKLLLEINADMSHSCAVAGVYDACEHGHN